MARIILASSSPRRQELLTKLGLSFEIQSAAVEEFVPDEAGKLSPAELVEALAAKKARAVAKELGKVGGAASAGGGVDENEKIKNNGSSAGAHAVSVSGENKKIITSREENSTALVIGADTVVVHRGEVLGKPVDASEAEAILRRLQGSIHEVFTGLAVVQVVSGYKAREAIAYERTLVNFRAVDDDEIKRYVATGEPMDKAGAYAIQGLGAIFVEGIEGCFFNVVGLPLALLANMLRSFGVFII